LVWLAAALNSESVRLIDTWLQPPFASSVGVVAVWVGITVFGSLAAGSAAALGGAMWLLRRGRVVEAVLMLVDVAGAEGLIQLAKHLVGRPRPPLLPFDVGWLSSLVAADPGSLAFPSGHALMSLAVYGYLAVVIGRASSIGAAIVLVLGVALSRLVLSVHWPIDILGGWILGAAWLCLLLALRSRLASRGSARLR
jgi:undecaprenyl-diphosphatase